MADQETNLQKTTKVTLQGDQRITVQLVGAFEDDGHLRLSEFIRALRDEGW